jgi:CBS domain containing-hemolysin-like protein
MKTIIVKELMVPIEEYATVPQEANLHDAVLALEEAQTAYDSSKHKHRAILVLDSEQNVVGKLDMLDTLKALEPKYAELDAQEALSQSGYSPEFIKSMLKDNVLWSEPLQFICSRAFEINVRDFMEVPDSCAYIEEDATLDEAIHQLIVCSYQSLLVTRDQKVVGVLRLSDVFTKICDTIKACKT